MTKDSPATRAFFQYLTEASAHEVWMSQGQFLTAHKGADLSAYSSPALRKQGEILLNATTFRFDASDLMPGAIGAGAFWSEMTAFANGQDAKTTADNIQAAWDAIKVSFGLLDEHGRARNHLRALLLPGRAVTGGYDASRSSVLICAQFTTSSPATAWPFC